MFCQDSFFDEFSPQIPEFLLAWMLLFLSAFSQSAETFASVSKMR